MGRAVRLLKCERPLGAPLGTGLCLAGIQQIVNYTNNIVGGTHGGPVTNTSWNSSFHGVGVCITPRASSHTAPLASVLRADLRDGAKGGASSPSECIPRPHPCPPPTTTPPQIQDVEIVADKYQLCAETLHPYEPSQAHSWIEFLSCLTGQDGIGICTLYVCAKWRVGCFQTGAVKTRALV